MSQEALLSVQMTDILIVSTLRSNHLLLRDTEIVHKQFSFTSCHASKKKNEWVQQKKRGFLMPLDERIKTVQALSDLHCEVQS